jgi:protein-disulfide isomerase
VTKTEKTKPATDITAGTSSGGSKTGLYIVAALVVLAIIGGAIYYLRGSGPADDMATELMKPGPLEDIVIGSADAPNTIVEYASMTCGHCANFHTKVFPDLKTKYIDTGKARFILREFPLDGLATAAFMVARCSGNDRYYPMVDGLFETQKTWAVPGTEGKEKLLLVAKQAGFSQERFDQCLADKELFDKIVEVRQRAHEEFEVDATPTFFINGKKLQGGNDIEQFDLALTGGAAEEAPQNDAH